eukprot:10698402-Alexandrium_andersonii.AAC.1
MPPLRALATSTWTSLGTEATMPRKTGSWTIEGGPFLESALATRRCVAKPSSQGRSFWMGKVVRQPSSLSPQCRIHPGEAHNPKVASEQSSRVTGPNCCDSSGGLVPSGQG